MSDPLGLIDDWPVSHAAAAVAVAGNVTGAAHGPGERTFELASVTKLLTALAVLVAVEEGTVGLDDRAGPPGSTVRHLLAHASGLGPGGETLTSPGRRRVYSNAGFETLAGCLEEASGLPWTAYATEAVLAPLGMDATSLGASGASGAEGTAGDLARLGAELLSPTLLARRTLSLATAVAFPGLAGVLPGFGRCDPNDWGLGFELRGDKSPHWTGGRNSPATFGHFGQAGGFLWVDPAAGVSLACLTDRDFGPWAAEAWPALSDAVLGAYG
ncbi:MAG: serine hydrolase domain-containing protein [Acidimicrobiia bacterium]